MFLVVTDHWNHRMISLSRGCLGFDPGGGVAVVPCSRPGIDRRGAVRDGMALAYRRYSRIYAALEAESHEAGRGIWAGRFEMPELWRHRPAR